MFRFSNVLWITAPQRLCLSLSATIASLMVSSTLFGEWCGLELSVGIEYLLFNREAFLHHFDIVPGLTPIYRDTFLIDQPLIFTNRTACILTFGMNGFIVYISLILPSGCFQAIETLRIH